MGILKHVVLPVFAVFHTSLAKICLYDGTTGLTSLFGLTKKKRDNDVVDGTVATPLEVRSTRSVGAIQLVFAINAMMAVFHENAHYRALAVLLETIYLSFESYGFWTADGGINKKAGTPTYCLLGLSLLGLGVHAMEPGIFTKDKTKK